MTETQCGVYRIRNQANGKVYIGSSVNIPERWRRHRKDCIANRHPNAHLQNAWNIYGPNNFVFEVIQLCSREDRFAIEQHKIDCAKSTDRAFGYNIEDVTNLGASRSEETKRKLSASKLGRHFPKLSECQRGRIITPSHRQRISAASKGKVLSNEHRHSISKALKGKTISDQHRERLRLASLQRYAKKTPDEEILSAYSACRSMRKAARMLHTGEAIIKKCLTRHGIVLEWGNKRNLKQFTGEEGD